MSPTLCYSYRNQRRQSQIGFETKLRYIKFVSNVHDLNFSISLTFLVNQCLKTAYCKHLIDFIRTLFLSKNFLETRIFAKHNFNRFHFGMEAYCKRRGIKSIFLPKSLIMTALSFNAYHSKEKLCHA